MEEPYETTCLYTASAIATALDQLPELHRNGGSRVVFTFPPDPRIYGIAKDFRDHRLLVNAFSFSRMIRDLKFALHQI